MPHRIVSLVRIINCQIGQQGRISIYHTGTTASMLSHCPYGPPRSPRSSASHFVRVLVVQCFCDEARSVQHSSPPIHQSQTDPAPGIRLAATSICHCRSIVVSSVPGKSAETTPSMQTTIPVPTRTHLHLTQHPIYPRRSIILPYILSLQAVAQPDFAMQF